MSSELLKGLNKTYLNPKEFTMGFLNRENFAECEYQIDEAWHSIDWTQDVKASYSDLLRERCEQLRNKYDYLILMYSGESDSLTVLNCFVNFGIKLDEVLMYDFAINGESIYPNYEFSFNYAKKLQSKGNFILNKITLTEEHLVKEKKSWEKHLFTEDYTNLGISPFSMRSNGYHSLSAAGLVDYSHVKRLKAYKNIAYIFGDKKPLISVDFNTGNVYSTFVWSFYGTRNTERMSNWQNVEFFTHTDLPELQLKQSHIVYGTLLQDKSFIEYLKNKNIKGLTNIAETSDSTVKRWLDNSPVRDRGPSTRFALTKTGQGNMIYNSISPIMLEKFNSTKHKDWNENSWFYHKLYSYDKKYYEAQLYSIRPLLEVLGVKTQDQLLAASTANLNIVPKPKNHTYNFYMGNSSLLIKNKVD